MGACRSVRSCRVARRRSFGGPVGTASSGSGRQGGRSLSGGCDGSGVAVVAVEGQESSSGVAGQACGELADEIAHRRGLGLRQQVVFRKAE